MNHEISKPTRPTRRTVLAAAGLACVGPAWAQSADSGPWPHDERVPGGVARIALGPAPERPQAFAGDVPLLVVGDMIAWTALVGIALAAKPGPQSIRVRQGDAVHELAYTIAPKRYAEQHLKVAPRTVDLSPEDLARYERERKHQEGVIATLSAPPPGRLAMRPPVPGKRSDSFGKRRFFNGQPRNPHSGMDIAAASGTPVVAPLAGTVTGRVSGVAQTRAIFILSPRGVNAGLSGSPRRAGGQTLRAWPAPPLPDELRRSCPAAARRRPPACPQAAGRSESADGGS